MRIIGARLFKIMSKQLKWWDQINFHSPWFAGSCFPTLYFLQINTWLWRHFWCAGGLQVCISQLPSPQRPSTPSSPNTTRQRPLTLLCHHCQKFAKHNTADCENVTSLNTYELALLNEKFYALNVSEEVTTQNLVTLRFYVNHAEVLTPHIYTTNNKAKSTE